MRLSLSDRLKEYFAKRIPGTPQRKQAMASAQSYVKRSIPGTPERQQAMTKFQQTPFAQKAGGAIGNWALKNPKTAFAAEGALTPYKNIQSFIAPKTTPKKLLIEREPQTFKEKASYLGGRVAGEAPLWMLGGAAIEAPLAARLPGTIAGSARAANWARKGIGIAASTPIIEPFVREGTPKERFSPKRLVAETGTDLVLGVVLFGGLKYVRKGLAIKGSGIDITSVDALVKEAKKYKTADDFITEVTKQRGNLVAKARDGAGNLADFWKQANKGEFKQVGEVKLTPERGLGQDLIRQGYKPEQIATITPAEAHRLLTMKAKVKAPEYNTKWLGEDISPQGTIKESVSKEIDDIQKIIDPKKKVSILDYLRTPDRVLKKIGMEKEAKLLRKKYNDYLQELPKEIAKVTQWAKRVPDPASNKRIFQWLDGDKIRLNPEELKVAGEVKVYLKQWAKRLGLPEDKQVSNYITHLFARDFIKKDFPDEIARLIDKKVAGSVYDPFLQRRVDKPGFKTDTWGALDAYIKRGLRKAHMDEALKPIKDKAKDLDVSSYDYIQKFISRVNLRPAHVDTLIDNFLKQTPLGYKLGERPTSVITRTFRNLVYKGTLGLNLKSAVKNLSQGVNTYARLGEKYTVIGYLNLFKKGGLNGPEIQKSGILMDNFIQDRHPKAVKRLIDTADKGLWVFFDTAEKINRASGYWGAKKKALDLGKTEKEAIEFATELVRDTQFHFSSVDTPMVLSNDISKSLLQFQSYNIKQLEFIGEMIQKKDIPGLIRFTGGTLVMLAIVGDFLGMDWKDQFFPQIKVGETPTIQGLTGAGQMIFGDEQAKKAGLKDVTRAATAHIPAGSATRRGIEGYQAYQRGYSETPSGGMRFPIEQTPGNLVKSVLGGQYSTSGAREYFDEGTKPLSAKQASKARIVGPEYYQKILADRQAKRVKDELTEAKTKEPGWFSKIFTKRPSSEEKELENYQIAFNLDKFSEENKPSSSIQLAEWKGKKLSAAKIILQDEDLSEAVKEKIITEVLREDPENVLYYSYASNSDTTVRRAVVDEMIAGETNRDKLVDILIPLRREIRSKRILSNETIDDLKDEGLLDGPSAAYLKKIKQVGNELQYTSGTGKKKGSAKKVSIGKAATIKLPTLSAGISFKPKATQAIKAPGISELNLQPIKARQIYNALQ